ncbi:MAG: hypothetical protein Q4G24_09845 [Paracoccus sp. (in: a-proteobacteria)]|uniref:hypothetical protein n=1 Tax=Paracoccus sp. TaxID=267 RepID=UPI0026DF6BF8|nr:hypothetical protein [Paracoccus sp. (in: a-proteobacteria)]MDO5621759.1 hypothetical protein [Paracoccus sp. (in: a-proteobacteria)]
MDPRASIPLRSKVVAILRVALPLAALAILSTLFLLSRKADPDAAIPYVEGELRGDGPGITAPAYSGVADDGTQLTFRAASVSQTGEGAAADQVSLNWLSPDGREAQARALTGSLDGDRLVLDGGVRLSTSDGWQVQAPRLEGTTDRSTLDAPDGIAGQAPLGAIEAGAMRLSRNTDGHTLLDFTGGVRLLYQP